MDDYEQLCEIFAEADAYHRKARPDVFRENEGSARTREYVSSLIAGDNSTLLVAESDNRIIGIAQAMILDWSNVSVMMPLRFVSVDLIAVSDDYRRQGVGEALLKSVEEWGQCKGAGISSLNVWSFNTGAIAFYNEQDYEPVSFRMWKSLKTNK